MPSQEPMPSWCPASEPRPRRWNASIDRASSIRSSSWIRDDRPYLGICLGLQLLFESSDEDGATTLGVLPGRTVRLEGAPTLPHIGWNQVERVRTHAIFDGIADDADFYFVHSYAGAVDDGSREAILAETTHGRSFTSAVASDALVGVQFHPERSGRDGLRLLANFVALVRARGAAPGRDRDAAAVSPS